MNKLKDIFKTNILNGQGTLLSKIVAKNLHKSNDAIYVDFEDIVDVKPIFFQEFLFPLVSEFNAKIERGMTPLSAQLNLLQTGVPAGF